MTFEMRKNPAGCALFLLFFFFLYVPTLAIAQSTADSGGASVNSSSDGDVTDSSSSPGATTPDPSFNPGGTTDPSFNPGATTPDPSYYPGGAGGSFNPGAPGPAFNLGGSGPAFNPGGRGAAFNPGGSGFAFNPGSSGSTFNPGGSSSSPSSGSSGSSSSSSGSGSSAPPAPPVKIVTFSTLAPSVAISPLIYGVNYTWTNAPFAANPPYSSGFTGLANPFSNPSEILLPSWVASTQLTQTGLSTIGITATFNRYPGGFDGEWYDWPDYLATFNQPSPINQMDCAHPGCQTQYTTNGTVPGTPPDFFITHMEPLLPNVPPASQMRAQDLINEAQSNPRNSSFELPIQQVVGLTDDMSTTGETQAQRAYQNLSNVTQSDLDNAVAPLVQEYMQILNHMDGAAEQVHYWEIGNEWWNQRNAQSNQTELIANLARYAYLLAKALPVIKAAYPDLKFYATAHWSTAGTSYDQFQQLMLDINQAVALIGGANLCSSYFAQGSESYLRCEQLSGTTLVNGVQQANVWGAVDGISIHQYCGTTVPASTCAILPQQVQKIISDTGKTDIYGSEWSVSAEQMPADMDVGIYNASATITAFQDMALAGIQEAAYWPVINVTPNLRTLLNKDYTPSPTGVVFGLMSQLYEGYPLIANITNIGGGSAGATTVTAAQNYYYGQGYGIILATNGDGPQTIQIPLSGLVLPGGGTPHGVTVSTLLSPIDQVNQGVLDNYSEIQISILPVSLVTQSDGSIIAQFTLAPASVPGPAGPVYDWNIVALELQ